MQNPRFSALVVMAGALVALGACGEAPTAPAAQVEMYGGQHANVIFTLASVTPASGTVAAGGTLQFTATNSAGSVMVAPDVTWSVSGGGTISPTGLFTAGAAAGTFTVIATGTANAATMSASVTVTATTGTGTGTGTGTCKAENGKKEKECDKDKGKGDDKGKDSGKGDDHKDNHKDNND